MLFNHSQTRTRAWLTIIAWITLGFACTSEYELAPRRVGVRRFALNAPVQDALGNNTVSTSISALFLFPITAGNLLVAIASHPAANASFTGPSGWTLAVNNSNSSPGQIIWYKVAGTSEPTLVTVSGFSTLVHTLRVLEFSGFDGKVAPAVATKTATSSSSLAFAPVTTTTPSSLLLAASVNVSTTLVVPTVSGWSNSFNALVSMVPLFRAESMSASYATASVVGAYTTTMTLDRSANVLGHTLAFTRLPVPLTNMAATSGDTQNSVTFNAPELPYTHLVILVKTGDCLFNATPSGSEARGTAVGNGTVIFNDSPDANLSATTVAISTENTSVAYAASTQTLTHSGLTNSTVYCYRAFVRNNTTMDTATATSPITRSATPLAPNTSSAPRFVVSSGSSSLAAASIIPGLGAFYADTNGRLLTVADSGSSSFAKLQLPDAVQSRGPAGTLTGDTESTIFLSALDGDAYAVWATGPSAGMLRWSTAAIDGDDQTTGDQPLGATLYAAPVVSRTLSRAFVSTRNASLVRNRIIALNALTGACVWVLNGSCTGTLGALNIGQISAAPVLDATNNRLLFNSAQLSGGDTVWAIDPRDTPTGNRVLWSRNLGSSDSSPTFTSLARDAILVGTNAGRIHKLDPSNGTTCWGTTDGCGGVATGTEQFFCTATNVNARATSCFGGSAIQKSILPVNGGAYSGNFVFSTADGNVRMVTSQGVQVWRTMVTGASTPLPIPELAGGKLYVGGGDGNVYELSLANGTVTATRSVGGGSVVAGAPAYDSAGVTPTLHLNTSQGNQYAFTVPF